MFREILLDLLSHEKDLVYEARASGHNVLKPSSILMIALTLFYTFSKIDILPEALLGYILGFFDDLVLIIISSIYVFADLSDFDITEITMINPFANLNLFDKIPNRKNRKINKYQEEDSENTKNIEDIEGDIISEEEVDEEALEKLSSLKGAYNKGSD